MRGEPSVRRAAIAAALPGSRQPRGICAGVRDLRAGLPPPWGPGRCHSRAVRSPIRCGQQHWADFVVSRVSPGIGLSRPSCGALDTLRQALAGVRGAFQRPHRTSRGADRGVPAAAVPTAGPPLLPCLSGDSARGTADGGEQGGLGAAALPAENGRSGAEGFPQPGSCRSRRAARARVRETHFGVFRVKGEGGDLRKVTNDETLLVFRFKTIHYQFSCLRLKL